VTFFLGLVRCDDNVRFLDDTVEFLIHFLAADLEFEDSSVYLVDEYHRLDPFTQGLSQYGFCLDAHSVHVIYHHKCSVGNS